MARWTKGSVSEIDEVLSEITTRIRQKDPEISSLGYYQKIADLFPHSFSKEKSEEALQAIYYGSPETTQSRCQRIGLRMHENYLSAIKNRLSENETENDDLVQGAVVSVYNMFEKKDGNLPQINPNIPIGRSIYYAARDGLSHYAAQNKNMPPSWLKDNRDLKIEQAIEELGGDEGLAETSADQRENIAEELAQRTGIGKWTLLDYFDYRISQVVSGGVEHDVSPEEIISRKEAENI